MNFILAMLDILVTAGVGVKGKPSASYSGVSMYAGQMPDGVTNMVALMPALTGNKIDHELPGYRKTGFQLVVRSKDIVSGEALAKQVMDALTIRGETNITGFQIKYVLPKHDPVSYPLSDGNNIELSVNFDATYVIV